MKGSVLITGGTGFVGAAILERIAKAGYDVSAVSRQGGPSLNHYALDLTNGSQVNEFIQQSRPFDMIVHCAAIAHGEAPPNNLTVKNFNSLITDNLVAAFSDEQPHWVFLSSVSIYGDTYSDTPILIENTPRAFEEYGKGKLADEQTLLNTCDNLDILRLPPVYDNDHQRDLRKRVFIPGTAIRLRIDPPPRYTLCHIGVVLDAVMGCLELQSGRRLHQIGDEAPLSQKILLELFSGPTLVISQKIFIFARWILPRKIPVFRKVRFMLKKMGLNNVFELDVREYTEYE